jgi:hypothetical protein
LGAGRALGAGSSAGLSAEGLTSCAPAAMLMSSPGVSSLDAESCCLAAFGAAAGGVAGAAAGGASSSSASFSSSSSSSSSSSICTASSSSHASGRHRSTASAYCWMACVCMQ